MSKISEVSRLPRKYGIRVNTKSEYIVYKLTFLKIKIKKAYLTSLIIFNRQH